MKVPGGHACRHLVAHSHGVGQNAFHLVCAPVGACLQAKPKYAKDPFKFVDVRGHCEIFLREIAQENRMEVFELQVETDHVHMFVNLQPTMSISKALQLLKGGSAYRLFR